MANGGVAVRVRWLLALVLAPALGVGTACAADLEAVWDAQLRGRLQHAQLLLEAGEPATPEHRFALASVALELGELDRAQAALEPLAGDAGHPDYPRAALLLGRLHLAAGRDGDARQALSASLERSAQGPYAAAAYLALIRLDLHAGAFDNADERLHRLAELGPSPELEIAAGLVSRHDVTGPVRPFPSPIGLFAAARLSGAAKPPPLPAPRQQQAGAGPPEPGAARSGQPTASGLQPIAPAGNPPAAEASTAAPAAAPQAAPNAGPATPPPGLRSAAGAADSVAGGGTDDGGTDDGGARFTLRLGSFRDRINAEHMVKALADGGFPARMRQNGDYRWVLVGAAATRQEAESLLKRLQSIGYDGDVIPYPADDDR